MSLRLTILNRSSDGKFTPPADGWYHLVPRGTYSHEESGTTQVLDDKAMDSLCNRFDAESAQPNFAGLLIDFDHFSYDPGKSSEAAGWLQKLQRRPDGLYGRIKWTDAGESAIRNGRYRFVSPTWMRSDCEPVSGEDAKTLRPLRLDSLALTNSPNLRGMAPLSNRNTDPRGAAMPRETKPTKKMKTVCTLLGLSPDAAEDAVHGEVAKLQNRLKTAEEASAPLKNRVTTLEAENKTLLEAQVETDLVIHKNRIPKGQEAVWKGQLLANRGNTLVLLAGLPEAKPGATEANPAGRLHNRETAGDPGQRILREADKAARQRGAEGEAANTPAAKRLAAAIRNRATQLQSQDKKLSYTVAFQRAKKELETQNEE